MGSAIATTAKSEKGKADLASGKRSSRPPTSSNSPATLNSAAGNLAVQRAARDGMIQAKLSVSQPGDLYEREADEVADRVMRMPEPNEDEDLGIQRKAEPPAAQRICTGCEEELQRQPMEEEMEEEELLQGKFTTNETATQRHGDVIGAENRTGMPRPIKAGLESLSGMNLSGVRVHYNSSKPAQLNSLAYTQGQDIHVGPRQEKHLPHEGWHAVQQMQGRVKPTMQAKGVSINDDASLEREADVMGAKALQMTGSSSKQRRGHHERATALQRQVVTKSESEVQRRPEEIVCSVLVKGESRHFSAEWCKFTKKQVRKVFAIFARAIRKMDDPALYEFRNELLDYLLRAGFYFEKGDVQMAQYLLIEVAERVKEKQEELLAPNFMTSDKLIEVAMRVIFKERNWRIAQKLRAAGNISDWILQAWEYPDESEPATPQYDPFIREAIRDAPARAEAATAAAREGLRPSNPLDIEFWKARLDPRDWTNWLPIARVAISKIAKPKARKSASTPPKGAPAGKAPKEPPKRPPPGPAVKKAEATAVPDAAGLPGVTVHSVPVTFAGATHNIYLQRVGSEMHLWFCSHCGRLLDKIIRSIEETSTKGPTKSLNRRLEKLRDKVTDTKARLKSRKLDREHLHRELNQIGAHLRDLSYKYPEAKRLREFRKKYKIEPLGPKRFPTPPQAIQEMMRSQSLAKTDLVDKGVHFNVGRFELKVIPKDDKLTLAAVFPKHAEQRGFDAAVAQGREALTHPAFREWIKKHARAGLEWAQEADNAAKVKEFTKVLEILMKLD